MRLNDMSMELARPRASCVLPVPGLSSSRMWPPTIMAVAHWRIGCSLPTTTWETLSTSLANWLWNSVMSACGADIMDEVAAGCAGLACDVVACGNWRGAAAGIGCDCGNGCCICTGCAGCAFMGCVVGTVGIAGLEGVALYALSTVSSSSPFCFCGCVGRLGAWNAGRICGLPGCCGLFIWCPMEPSWVASSSFSVLMGAPCLLLLVVLMIGCRYWIVRRDCHTG